MAKVTITECEECGASVALDTEDADGILEGAECSCGYYVTRYTKAFASEVDWL